MTKTQFDFFKSQARRIVSTAKDRAREIAGAFDTENASDLSDLLKEKLVVFDVGVAIKAISDSRRGYIPDLNLCVRPANATAIKAIAKRSARYEKACSAIDTAFDKLIADAVFQGRKFDPKSELESFKTARLEMNILKKV